MKTIFEQFAAYNAGCIEEAVMPLEEQGLVLIRGENHDEGDSNGSGKTTLFELMAHTLFGKTSKGPRKNSLLNKINPQDFHTQCRFRRDPGSRYLIDQYRKHSDNGTCIEIRVDGAEKSTAPPKYEDAQKKVMEHVGLVWNQFQGQVYLSQKYTHTMLEGLPSEKQAYMSRYFGLEMLDTLITDVSTRLNAIPLPDESQLREMLDHVTAELEGIGDVEEAREALSITRKKQSKLQKKILDIRVKLDSQLKAQEVDVDRKKWSSRLTKMKLRLDADDIKSSLNTYRKRARDLKAFIKAIATHADLEKRLESLGVDTEQSYDEVAAEVEELAKQVKQLEKDLYSAQRREDLLEQLSQVEPVDEKFLEGGVEGIRNRLEAKEKKRDSVANKVTVLRSEIAQLETIEEVCPTCSRPMDEHEREDMLEEKRQRFDKLSARRSDLNEAVADLQFFLDSLTARLKLEAKLGDLPDKDAEKVQRKLDAAANKRTRLSKLASKLVKAAGMQERLADIELAEESQEELESRLEKTERRIERLEDAYEFAVLHGDVEFDVEELQRLQASLEHYDAKLEGLNDAVLDQQDKVSKGESYAAQKKELEKSLNTSSSKKNHHQALHYVNVTLKELKKMGLRESSELLTQVLPVYLSHFYPQGSVQLRVTDKADGFDLIFEKGGQSISLPEISGGQAKRVGIAIIFAFAKMGRRTTNLLIADEPFIHLDRRGREACYELLRDLDIGTVLVTAHDQDLQATRKYDQIWTVRMQDHRSRLYLDG